MATSNSRAVPFMHLPELDGVRGIAALLVFFHHLCFANLPAGNWGPHVVSLRNFFEAGSVGVDIFFVLSGFLITSLLIRDRANPAFYRDFYWKRALRILPLYIVCLTGVLIFIPHSGGYVLFSALFIVNFSNVLHVQTAGPFWTLAIEEQFYLIWPTVVRRRHVSQLRNWTLAIIAVIVLLRGVAAAIGHYNYHLTPLRADGLAAGAFLAAQFEQSRRNNQKAAIHAPWLITALIVGFALSRVQPLFAIHTLATAAFFNQSAVTLMCAGAVGLVIAYTGSKYLQVLRSPVLTFFGLISYAFYMLHLYVLMAYDKFFPLAIGDSRAYAIRIGVVLAITIAASLLSRYLIELPALSLRKRVLKQPAPEAETQMPLSPHTNDAQAETSIPAAVR